MTPSVAIRCLGCNAAQQDARLFKELAASNQAIVVFKVFGNATGKNVGRRHKRRLAMPSQQINLHARCALAKQYHRGGGLRLNILTLSHGRNVSCGAYGHAHRSPRRPRQTTRRIARRNRCRHRLGYRFGAVYSGPRSRRIRARAGRLLRCRIYRWRLVGNRCLAPGFNGPRRWPRRRSGHKLVHLLCNRWRYRQARCHPCLCRHRRREL